MQEILPKTGMNLEDIMPNEIGKTEKDKCYMISLMCALLKKKVELRGIGSRLGVAEVLGVGVGK